MKVVLDTSVIAAGLQSDAGASRAVLHLVYEGRLQALASTAVYIEYEDVLTRPPFLARAGIDLEDVRRFLRAFALLAHPVAIDISWRPASPDPDDDRIIDCAVNGGAAVLVTHNVGDLATAERFGIQVMRPGKLLWSLRR